MLTVHGTYLTSIQRPRIFAVLNRRKSEEMTCTVLNITVMLCPSPRLPSPAASALRRVARETVAVETSATLGFVMDDVASVRNLSWSFPEVDADLVYVPNPVYKPFVEAGNTKLYRGDSLIIEGENLNLASDTG
ncbi:PREDICTED: plexin-B-like [Priapulus caudatus]|uniref:Plexin-B-like n=1 Tax=Priapulus caudatus TaxID=37621 RepID=A0ABM1F4W6_PRICU|nr:PREDICTED: plexin-B-like [Priapulus caudatus]